MYISGPGLAIRVICQAEPFMQTDFSTTNSILRVLMSFRQLYHTSAPGVQDLLQLLTVAEQETLFRVSESQQFHATLLPIRTVGVQVGGVLWRHVVTSVMSCENCDVV